MAVSQAQTDALIRVRRHLHRHPETSNREVATSAYLFEQLTKMGLEPEYIDPENKIGVFADITSGRPGPFILYRADIDALPVREHTGLDFASENEGVMHACGHDLHMTLLLGTVRQLLDRKAEWRGTVRAVFQEGEENSTGARKVIARGLLEGIDYALAVHTWPELPAGKIGMCRGPAMASNTGIEIHVHGNGGHGAHPHRGIDPILAGASIVTALQSITTRNLPPIESAVLTFGKFAAGTAENVIPDEAELRGTFRCLSDEAYALLCERIPAVAKTQAETFGATADITLHRYTKVVYNDPAVFDILAASARASIGDENFVLLPRPAMESEDFSLYLDACPGAVVRLGTACDDKRSELPLHHREIIFAEASIPTGVAFMTRAIINLSQAG